MRITLLSISCISVVLSLLITQSTFAATKEYGQPASVSWSVSNANSCVSSWGGSVGAGGSQGIGVLPPGTYTYSCSEPSSGASGSDSLTIVCPSGQSWNGSGCYCPAGQYPSMGSCTSCPSGTYGTGNNICTNCPGGYTSPTGSTNSGQCTSVTTDTCGTASGATPQASKPTGSNACIYGSYNGSASYDTATTWGWGCGSLSCFAPKYGCNVLHATNYNPTGPNNSFGCSGSCDSGYVWNSYTSTCELPGSYSCSGVAPIGGNFTSVGASTGNGIWSYSGSGAECTWVCNGGYTQSGNSCTATTPPSGVLTADKTSCIVPFGQGTCPINLTWSTLNPRTTSSVTSNKPSANTSVASGNSGSQQVNISPTWGTAGYFLYNILELASVFVSSSCASGGGFDSLNNICANPQVDSITVTGQYYQPSGNLRIVCTDSDNYEVKRNGDASYLRSGVYSGTPVTIPVSVTDTYIVTCKHGNYSGPSAAKTYHSPPPPPPKATLEVSPRTIVKRGSVTLTWATQFPTPTCRLTAKVICTNNNCTDEQLAWQTSVNTLFTTQWTDTSDPNGSRKILDALTKIIPSHMDTDWKALGKKTITKVQFTTDFTNKCLTGTSETKRVQVAKSAEH